MTGVLLCLCQQKRVCIRLVKRVPQDQQILVFFSVTHFLFFFRFIFLLHFCLYPNLEGFPLCDSVMLYFGMNLLLDFVSPNLLIPFASIISKILDKVKKVTKYAMKYAAFLQT